jgi:hypothetical protein
MRGLRRVRRFRRCSQWLQYLLLHFVSFVNKTLGICRFRSTGDTQILVWSKESCYQPTVGHSITRVVNEAQHLPFHEVDNSPSRERSKPRTDEEEQEMDVADRC